MLDVNFRVNPNVKVQQVIIGREKTPVIILDDFLEELSSIREGIEHSNDMSPDESSYYPGIRSDLPIDYAKNVVANVFKQLYSVYNIPKEKHMNAVNLVYSLITKQPNELQLHQKRPHFDTPSSYHFAILHYLNEGSYGPTGFFRHKRTGLERITANMMDDYLTLVGKTITDENVDDGYVKATNSEYELIYQVPYKANRLIIYPGNLLHSILIQEETDIDPNPKTGRLTANIFIEYT